MSAIEIYNSFEGDAQRIINYLGLTEYYANDVLTEFYIKLHQMQQRKQLDRLYIKEQLNAPYLFTMISNLVSDFRKSNKNYEYLNGHELSEPELDEHLQLKQELAQHFIENMPDDLVNIRRSKFPFDKILLQEYLSSEESIRSLSKATKIGRGTINNSLKKSKKLVRSQVDLELKKLSRYENKKI